VARAKVILGLILALVIQWLPVARAASLFDAACKMSEASCECCVPASCPCADETGQPPVDPPLAPPGDAFKLERAPSSDAITPHGATTLREIHAPAPPAADDSRAGYRGQRLTVSFCRFLI
jgi:hypothetical protein